MASMTQWTGFVWILRVGDNQGGLPCCDEGSRVLRFGHNWSYLTDLIYSISCSIQFTPNKMVSVGKTLQVYFVYLQEQNRIQKTCI